MSIGSRKRWSIIGNGSKKIFLSAVCAVLYIVSFAQEGGPPMLTEDPEVAEEGTWEINTSLNPIISNRLEMLLPNLDINYGVVRDLQFHIGIPHHVDISKRNASASFGSLEFGVKIHFFHEERSFISVGTHPILQFTGDKEFSFPLLVQKTIGRFLVGDALTPFWANQNGLRNGFLIGYKPTESTGLMSEYFVEKIYDEKSGTNGYINLGIRHIVAKHATILISFGTQVMTRKGEPKDYFIGYLGVQSIF